MEKKSILMIDDVKFNLASAREVLKDEYNIWVCPNPKPPLPGTFPASV